MVSWTTIVLYLIVLKYVAVCAKEVRKFVYQKDISEHCRRQVMPSVFLGRHVVEANSQILHFSRLDLPYSCFISIRAESGSNIILFIQLLSQKSLKSSCSQFSNQLLVYEMGETAGGYWGPLPPDVLEQKPTQSSRFYTLKTTKPTTASTTSSTEDVTENTETTEANLAVKLTEEERSYIRMEIPIVNVSGQMIVNDSANNEAPSFDDSYFDIIYDVLPGRGESYKTSILPLVQFSATKDASPRRFGAPPLYELSYDSNPFTPDVRLRYPTIKLTNTNTKRKGYYSATKRLHFAKSKLFLPRTTTSMFRRISTKPRLLYKITTRHTEHIRQPGLVRDYNSSGDLINTYLGTINKDKQYTHENNYLSLNASALLQNIADMEHNRSVYLAPNLSIYNELANTRVTKPTASSYVLTPSSASTDKNLRGLKTPENKTYEVSSNNTERIHGSETQKNTNTYEMKTMSSSTTEDFGRQPDDESVTYIATTATQTKKHTVENKNEILDTLKVSPLNLASDTDNLNASQGIHLQNSIVKNIKPTSTVDHESWENVVQAAHAIASVLSQAVDNIATGTTTDSQKHHDINNVSRKKRHIHPIPIEDAKPHRQNTRTYTTKTTKPPYKMNELQSLAQLVEFSEDEMHGHVILRNPRQYVGPVMFNICNTELSDRQVFLFNSSRIVMALNNFIIDRMTVVLTPARTLLSTSGHCSPAHLECQVSGARVCINSMCACDGIPNCGSYDIYDEDRLMCGAGSGLQHNVCLAAFTFLAVLLTLLYTVHYWLRRCVPKVSQAFFIYTNGGENELYLEPVMRSPYDMDGGPYKSAIPYPDNLFDDDIPYLDSNVTDDKPKSTFVKIFKALNIFKSKRVPTALSLSAMEPEHLKYREPRKMYSFAEFEIRNNVETQLTAEAAIQTGDSIEMAYMNKIQNLNNLKRLNEEKLKKLSKPNHPPIPEDTLIPFNEPHPDKTSNQKKTDELSILKFFNNAKSESAESVSADIANVSLKESFLSSLSDRYEREIQSHMYDSNITDPGSNSTRVLDEMSYQNIESSRVKKHLRFNEDATTIPADDRSDEIDNEDKRRSFISGVGKIRKALDLDTIDEKEEETISTGIDHRSFWGSNKKGKKAKKNVSTLR